MNKTSRSLFNFSPISDEGLEAESEAAVETEGKDRFSAKPSLGGQQGQGMPVNPVKIQDSFRNIGKLSHATFSTFLRPMVVKIAGSGGVHQVRKQ